MPLILAVLGQRSVTVWPIGETLTPIEGPIAIQAALNFSIAESFLLDAEGLFGSANPLAAFSGLQTIYIDASGTDSVVTVFVAQTQQTIVAKGRTQGYYPLVAPNLFNITVSCSDSLFVAGQVILCNYFVPPAVWATK